MEKIINDSCVLQNYVVSSNYDLVLKNIKIIIPLINDFNLLIKFYNNVYEFKDAELIQLCSNLFYLESSKLKWILLIMKTKNLGYFRSKISYYLIKDYDNIFLEENLFLSSILYEYFNLSEYLIKVFLEI